MAAGGGNFARLATKKDTTSDNFIQECKSDARTKGETPEPFNIPRTLPDVQAEQSGGSELQRLVTEVKEEVTRDEQGNLVVTVVHKLIVPKNLLPEEGTFPNDLKKSPLSQKSLPSDLGGPSSRDFKNWLHNNDGILVGKYQDEPAVMTVKMVDSEAVTKPRANSAHVEEEAFVGWS